MKMQSGVPEWDFITVIIHLQSAGCGVRCHSVKGKAEIYQNSFQARKNSFADVDTIGGDA